VWVAIRNPSKRPGHTATNRTLEAAPPHRRGYIRVAIYLPFQRLSDEDSSSAGKRREGHIPLMVEYSAIISREKRGRGNVSVEINKKTWPLLFVSLARNIRELQNVVNVPSS